MTSTLKYVHIDKLSKLVNKYSNTYHNTIKMDLADVMSSTYFGFSVKKEKYSKFKGSNHGRISTYKNNFAKITF